MLKILERYLAKAVISATAITALVITAILFIMTLLGEFKNLGDGDYGFWPAVIYVILRLPNELYQFSPMLILLGSIIGLSILSTHRELAVMRASGFSMRKIIYSVFAAALMMIFFISLVGELIGPDLQHRAEIQKENLQNAGQAVVTTAGVWLHVDNNFIHVNRVVGKELYEGVTRYQFDKEHRLMAAYYAKTMISTDGAWMMHGAVKTTFMANRTMSESYPQLAWDLHFNSSLLNTGMTEPAEMTLPKLIKFSRYLEKNGLQSTQYRFEFWERVFTPLASLVMIFLAIPFVLSVFSRSAMGWRLMVGVLAGFTFFILNAFLGQLSIVYQVPPMLAALIPILLFAVVGIFLAKKLLTT
jgi:lipopolysaccharide export system permease protein